jgi:hypothetical protein
MRRFLYIAAVCLVVILVVGRRTRLLGGPRSCPPLTIESLRNAAYFDDVFAREGIRLTEGVFESRETPAAYRKVSLEQAAFGDMDGKPGTKEAAVLLWTNMGGTGNFRFICIVAPGEKGDPQWLASTHASIGDRIKVQDFRIVDGKVLLDALVHGPKDPMCCPTQTARMVFRLDGRNLIRAKSPETTSK